jgi:hypothetical protein
MLIACGSQANLARQSVNNHCSNLLAPPKSIADKEDLINFKGLSYVLTERYIWSQSHIITLSDCVSALVCSQKWSDYAIECNKQRSFLRELILGRSSCDVIKPEC